MRVGIRWGLFWTSQEEKAIFCGPESGLVLQGLLLYYPITRPVQGKEKALDLRDGGTSLSMCLKFSTMIPEDFEVSLFVYL